ncbi:hypothetical protein EST38_g13275 [Candolleomyces aberdarensis]|uniref:Uncharacterized protein n=1 Tax=Candolleomyces aberdarensis TaxID=2316362 RepID=A0A4Q2D0C4_9AGAR|nr:hypothetical protein EST38_g13275 [Candolleomyces aberdarensis]
MPPLRDNNPNANAKLGRANPLARTKSYGKGIGENPLNDAPDPFVPKAKKSLGRLRTVASPTTPTPSMRPGRRPTQSKQATRKSVLFLSPLAQPWSGPTTSVDGASSAHWEPANLRQLSPFRSGSDDISPGHYADAGSSSSSTVDSESQSQSLTSGLGSTQSGLMGDVSAYSTPPSGKVLAPMSSGHRFFYSPLSSRAQVLKTMKVFTPARVKIEEQRAVIPPAHRVEEPSPSSRGSATRGAGLGSPFDLAWPSLQMFELTDDKDSLVLADEQNISGNESTDDGEGSTVSESGYETSQDSYYNGGTFKLSMSFVSY